MRYTVATVLHVCGNGPEISAKVEDLSMSIAGPKYCKQMRRGDEESSAVLHAGNIRLKHLQQQQQTYQTRANSACNFFSAIRVFLNDMHYINPRFTY